MLAPQPCCAFQTPLPVARCGGIAILPWRPTARAAAPLPRLVGAGALAVGSFQQAAVLLDKGAALNQRHCAEAWRLLAPGGRLLLAGATRSGIGALVKAWRAWSQQESQVLANRARARVVLLHKTDEPGPPLPAAATLTLPDGHLLQAPPGTFAAGRLDAGSALLLDCLSEIVTPPRRILDLGAGIGTLALVALQRWPMARATLLEADAQACAAARANAAQLGCAERVEVYWWDALEDRPAEAVDLVLCNPPFHRGSVVDYAPARAMFRYAVACLAGGGQLLLVANRQLPYEAELRRLAFVRELRLDRGFKVLLLEPNR